MAKDKEMLGEALDLLYGICRKIALNGDTHDNITRASQVIRAEIDKVEEAPKEEEPKKGVEDGKGA